MKYDNHKSADKAVRSAVKPVENEQGAAKEAGGSPPASFGHTSAKSAGVSGSIPKDK